MSLPEQGPERASRLPRRDLLLIPLLALLTCLALFGLAELGARVFWPSSEDDPCVMTDPSLGHRFRPHCVSRVKSMEGPWVTNRYNACGYRTDGGCGPRAPGVRRVDLLGSSTAQGYLIPYEGTVAASLARDLARQCRAAVELENMGMIGYQGEVIVRQLDEALALHPDAIVFLVTPFDFDPSAPSPGPAKPGAASPGAAPEHVELLRRLRNLASGSQALALAQHLMFTDNQRFASLYLGYGDRADFLRPPFSPAWRRRLAYLDGLLGRIKARLDPAGVKLVLAYVPSRVQAIYLAAGTRPAGIDPFAFGQALGAIARAHGAAYVDMSDSFARLPDPGSLFYPQDGHLTAAGQPLVGRAIARQIVASAAAFQGCARSDSALLTPSEPKATP